MSQSNPSNLRTPRTPVPPAAGQALLVLLAQRVRAARRDLRLATRTGEGARQERAAGAANEAWNALQSAKALLEEARSAARARRAAQGRGLGARGGAVIHEGPSVLDGSPIVAIATGIDGGSRNPKTGAMVQTWILRADRTPTDAVRDGSDRAVCGDCALRGAAGFAGRRCYVNVGNGPQSVWYAWQRGSYPALEAGRLAGLRVRLGAYGDPAAVPVEVWQRTLVGVAGGTGYTHQWAHPSFDARLLWWCMASVGTDAEVALLQRLHPGARYFRVRRIGEEASQGEMQCPASAEAGRKLDCVRCGACDGMSAARIERSVTIAAHGASPQMRTWRANPIAGDEKRRG